MKFFPLFSLFLVTVILTSCSIGENGQSSLIPKNSVVVTTSPSIAIAPCSSIRVDKFLTTNSFASEGKTYTLLGVNAEPIANEKEKEDFFAFLKQKGFCIKEDPSYRDQNLVYLFTSENGLINGEVLRRGLGTAVTKGDFIYKEYLQNLEEEARANKAGIWSNPDRLAAAPAKPSIAEDSSSYPLVFPESAAQHAGETITLRLRVGSIGESTSALYLNSEKDYTSEANVPVVISFPATAETKALTTRAKGLEGKTIDATGTVQVLGGRAQVLVTEDANLTVME